MIRSQTVGSEKRGAKCHCRHFPFLTPQPKFGWVVLYIYLKRYIYSKKVYLTFPGNFYEHSPYFFLYFFPSICLFLVFPWNQAIGYSKVDISSAKGREMTVQVIDLLSSFLCCFYYYYYHYYYEKIYIFRVYVILNQDTDTYQEWRFK